MKCTEYAHISEQGASHCRCGRLENAFKRDQPLGHRVICLCGETFTDGETFKAHYLARHSGAHTVSEARLIEQWRKFLDYHKGRQQPAGDVVLMRREDYLRLLKPAEHGAGWLVRELKP